MCQWVSVVQEDISSLSVSRVHRGSLRVREDWRDEEQWCGDSTRQSRGHS